MVGQKGNGRGRPRVVVIGSGFGGLFCVQGLKHVDVEITLIAETTHHLFQPLLYQVATGILSEGEIAPATREVLARQRNVTVLLGSVSHIDVADHTVTSRVPGQTYVTAYDYLVVAAGAGPSYFGNDQFAQYAPGLKSIDDALELRGRILGAFELAECAESEDDIRRLLTFVVVGAGPTGVEVAGQIAELAHVTLTRDFRNINTDNARVLLVDGADQVLPPFGTRLGASAHRKLESLGVEIRLATLVTDVDADTVTVRDADGHEEQIASMCKVWAAGVAGSALGQILADQTPTTLDRSGRIEVQPDLTLPGHPAIYCIGDMTSLANLPGVAQVAMQQGRYAAAAIGRQVTGSRPQPPFRYRDKGSMAMISRFSAVAKVGRLQLSGFLAWLLWLGVHLVYLVGFKSRVTTLLHWTITFIGTSRAERTVTTRQAVARTGHGRADPAQ
ncbi:MAG: NAD(P)/FAD-dependent oxidoreductase [Nostocoides sp.]